MGEIISTPKKYYNFRNGWLYRKGNGTEPTQTRTYKDKDGNQKTVEGIFISGYEEKIKSIEIKQNEVDNMKFETLQIEFVDSAVLQFPESLILEFLAFAPNIDFDKKTKVVPYRNQAGYIRLSVKQSDENVKHYFYDFDKKTGINGAENLPIPKDWKNKKEVTIFNLEKDELYRKMFTTNVLPKLKESFNVIDEIHEPIENVFPEPQDDLPF